MRIHSIAAALLLSLAGLPALAEDPQKGDPFSQVEPQLLLRGIVTERDVGLLFDHLRLSLAAAAAGREPPPAPALEQRAGEIGDALRLRSVLLGLVMLNALEARAKEALRTPGRPDAGPQESPKQD